MKNKMLRSAVLLLLAVVCLSSCSKHNKFDTSSAGFVDKKTGVEYKAASWEYEPINVTDEIYAEYKKEHDVEFYCLAGIDPQKFVSGTNGSLYYSSSVTLPTLKEMKVDFVDVYDAEDTRVYNITDKAFIEKLVDTYTKGYNVYNSISINNSSAFSRNHRFKFANSELGIYYVLAYIEYAEAFSYTDENGKHQEGNKLLYNRYTGKYVVVDDFISEYYAAQG